MSEDEWLQILSIIILAIIIFVIFYVIKYVDLPSVIANLKIPKPWR
ncbi:MAG: hypothetical protein QXS37_03055 [Candidatus Aenigmatarchaeota archaeon]